MTRAEKPLKAFVVQEEDEGTGGVVFAKTNAQARREGAAEFGGGEWDAVTCRRASWADEYVEAGHVPVRAYLERGWWWECSGCGQRISEDAEFNDAPTWTIEDVVEPRRGIAFHNDACREADEAYHAERVRRQDRAIERFKGVVRRRFPGVLFAEPNPKCLSPHHAYASRGASGWRVTQVVVSFDFPGMSYAPAQLRYDDIYGRKRNKPYYSCCAGDREAFEAYAAITKAGAAG